jgi:hypothetical protein
MLRPFLSFVLALATVGAPLAADMCEATCAARDAAAPAAHHSCHQAGSSQQGASVAAIHLCGHDDGAPTVIERIVQSVIVPAVVPTVAIAALSRPAPRLVATPFDSSPPIPLDRISQLRV